MFFSVIVPVYNVEKYLDDCINSVIDQTFDDYEIVLVDDGSTDGSPEMCDFYKEKYPDRIKVIHKQNEGQLFTRLKGMNLACGEYYLFLDSDDKFRSDAMEKIHNVIIAHDSDLILFNYSKKSDYTEEKKLDFTPNTYVDKKELYEAICSGSDVNNLCFKCAKRDIVDLNMDFSELSFLKNAEDLLQSIFLINNCKRPFYLDETLYYYRYNNVSITNLYQDRLFDSVKTVRLEVIKYAGIWGVEEKIVYTNCLNVCISIMKYILSSKIDFKMKMQKISNIINDDFFKTSYEKANIQNTKDKFLLWFFIKINGIGKRK